MALSHEERLRIDLAATFRVIAHLGMHEAVANHFSAAVSADGKRFLASPANNSVTTNDGWRLRFASWQDEKAAHPLPKRIDAARTTASGELEIRIIINPANP